VSGNVAGPGISTNGLVPRAFSLIRLFSPVCEKPVARVETLTGGVFNSPKPLKFEKKSPDHETIFLNHYDWLLNLFFQIDICKAVAVRRAPARIGYLHDSEAGRYFGKGQV
jgi:hypothetical protein